MKLQFRISNKSKRISYRFTNGRAGLDVSKSIPLKLSSTDKWNSKKQLTDSNMEINTSLLELSNHIIQSYNTATSNGIPIDKAWMQLVHNQFFNPKSDIKPTPILFDFIKDYKVNVCKSESLKAKLNTLLIHINNFDKISLLKDIDSKWSVKFQSYLLDNHYAESTINKSIQLLKQLIRFAQDEELEVRNNFLSSKSLKSSTITHYLNEDEVNDLFKFKPSTKALDNTRKLFLIGCTTGLRISDLMKIKYFNIKNGMIELTTKKTKQNIVVPIDPRVKGFISEVKTLAHPVFNRNIKELFKEIGMTEITKGYIKGKGNKRVLGMYPKYKLITSHSMRRTFATNLYGKLPTMVIMAITGHTTEKSFLTYIKKPQLDFANELKEFYNNRV